MTRPLVLSGPPLGSPYTHKMKSLLTYRRAPYEFVFSSMPGQGPEGLPKPPRPLFPCIYFPEGDGDYRATSDSTFQIRELESLYAGRSVVPTDPALAFLDTVLEDYADEWVTKMMFHYRWGPPENVENASKMLPLASLGVPDSVLDHFAKTFAPRQIDRLSGVVTGSLEVTGPLIEASYARLLAILRDRLVEHPFLLGSRPGAGDFGLQGQLTQLVRVEPSSTELARTLAPRVKAWAEVLDDLSGWPVDGDKGWLDRDALGEGFRELLGEIGRSYAPFMLANADALARGDENMECQLEGKRYWQRAFPYQGKCLGWLRDEYARLGESDRGFVDGLLAGTGCEALVR
jgi:glutathione S-transferase